MKKMKIWSLLMLMVLALPTMVACGDDGEEEGKDGFTLVGKWTMYSVAKEDRPERIRAVIVFKSNNTGTFESYNSSGESYGIVDDMTYSLDGNALSFDIAGDDGTWYITIVSSKEFRTSQDGGLIFRKQ